MDGKRKLKKSFAPWKQVKHNLNVFGIKMLIRKNVKYVTELTVEAVEESPVEIYTSQQDDINRWGCAAHLFWLKLSFIKYLKTAVLLKKYIKILANFIFIIS